VAGVEEVESEGTVDEVDTALVGGGSGIVVVVGTVVVDGGAEEVVGIGDVVTRVDAGVVAAADVTEPDDSPTVESDVSSPHAADTRTHTSATVASLVVMPNLHRADLRHGRRRARIGPR
jgi:hypothetical protein